MNLFKESFMIFATVAYQPHATVDSQKQRYDAHNATDPDRPVRKNKNIKEIQ